MLPFLNEKKFPKIKASDPLDEKLVNGSGSDELEDGITRELMESAASKDVPGFRAALRALVMNHKEES